MTAFHDYLGDRLASSGFTTEDVLASFLPLVREALDAHAVGMVAPLEGLDDLRVEGVRIWYEEAKRQPIRHSPGELKRIQATDREALEVVVEARRTTDVDEGPNRLVHLNIATRDTPVIRPVYLPGYVSWEHLVSHHDPLTDIFSLGMILASLACGLDLTEPKSLERFVTHRGNLFELQPRLHPVVARAIYRMTELNRHRRAQDLPALLQSLENYRAQDIDFEFDLAREPDFPKQDRRTKQTVVLGKLRERLFELSRRNRLLHFRATMQTVNLTHASVPLSFDVRNIRENQILVWNDALQKSIASGRPLSLNRYLNFTEALYLPGVLDQLIANARRDLAEYGFAQLRLVACFLHWANLKEQPVEQFESPFVLLPVRLVKKKGIRDTYYLEAMSSVAEINPVIRHQFKQLYAIDLPESVDFTEVSLNDLFEDVKARIERSDPAVNLSRIDRPRIDVIHDKARRKLDHYRRRARIAGRGVRSFMELDYSYDPANFHPLGIKLFSAKVRPPGTQLRTIIEEKPRPRSFAVPEEPPVPQAEKERSLFRLRSGGEENPYHWTFDLCSVTLANFKYRKMSLVRDYETLLAEQPANPAFETTFSLAPRPVDPQRRDTLPLESRFDVVACDPTQATAIAEARDGESYIIQGPPGTGKSQTITNLIADYVARGKRVLFVCEKRAAIDVVFARLRQCGLGDLCCLIHDSQADKKAFVMDLKETYESFLGEGDDKAANDDGDREKLLTRLNSEVEPLEHFNAAMHRAPENVGMPVRQLIGRCVALKDGLPEMSPVERERLPDFATWLKYRDKTERFKTALQAIQADLIFANHPLHLLAPRLASAEGPLEQILSVLDAADEALERIMDSLASSELLQAESSTVRHVAKLIDYAQRVQNVSSIDQMALLGPRNKDVDRFLRSAKRLAKQSRAVDKAIEANARWKMKLTSVELVTTLEQARALELGSLPWLKPAWWRLRSILNRSYDFRSHAIRPRWTQVLTELQEEYAQRTKLDERQEEIADQYALESDVEETVEQIVTLRKDIAKLPPWLHDIHDTIVKSAHARSTIDDLLDADRFVTIVVGELQTILEQFEDLPLEQLRRELKSIRDHLDELPDFLQCVAEISDVPDAISDPLRRLSFRPEQIEAATADASLEDVYRADRVLHRFNGKSRQRRASRLERHYASWLTTNASEIRQRVKRRFLEHVHTASLSASQLNKEQKQFKKQYNRGRRELEHEFGKSMRYKAIRDLVADESGIVVQDLKPIWLMSPLSVSDTLPLDTDHVDVVIFDEASQITLEEAVPSIFRAQQAIVVGDEMQLPPTDFFSSKRSDEEDELLVEEDGEIYEYDLESNSFLNHAAKNLPSTMLGWHYRSRSESLISFSNWAFYGGRLLTVPEEQLPGLEQEPLCAEKPEDGEPHAAELLRRSISFHFMNHGVYENRRNRGEAQYIAHLVRGLFQQDTGVSIGIVAFSEAQQSEIETALLQLGQEDAKFRDRLEAEMEREEDGQFLGLLVKNLENIQGDERDVIILSVCYGHDASGKMRMNFGPINRSGGEKRLNVAFSRAKHHMALVSSIHSSDIKNDYNDGANCLKNYLHYAEAVAVGNTETANRVLHGMSAWHGSNDDRTQPSTDSVVEQLAAALVSRGLVVERQVGQSHFRCDLAVRNEGDNAYRLGILVDTEEYYAQTDLLEREMMRPKLLRNFGWNIAHVLAKDWYADREAVVESIVGRTKPQEDRPAPSSPSE